MPSGATDRVPNHCHAWFPAGSSFTRTGLDQVRPPSVLWLHMTSTGSFADWTLASRYTQPARGPFERSTPIQICPHNPLGFGPPMRMLPPRFTEATVNVGVCPANIALV